MRLIGLIFSLIILWVSVWPTGILDISMDPTTRFEVHLLPHYDASLPERVVGDFEPLLSLHFLAPFIPLQNAIAVFAQVEQLSTLLTLPSLHLKRRVLRN